MQAGLTVGVPSDGFGYDPLQVITSEDFIGAKTTLGLRSPSSLRVITYNVWFDPRDMAERLATLVRSLLREAPDLIGLQEVVPRVEAALRGSSALRALYNISPFDVGRYGCLILARSELGATFRQIEIPTLMERTLLVADCAQLPGFTFATVHLESLSNAATRQFQLQEAARVLAGGSSSVLCGDFNFDSVQSWGDWRAHPAALRPPEELENNCLTTLLPDFVDAWPAAHPLERGVTFDGAINPYVHDSKECMRYDRVMVHGQRVARVWLLGVEEPASDHYGVCVDLTQ